MPLPEGVRRLFRLGLMRSDVERDLDDELAHHFAEAVADLRAQGCTEEEALARARSRFGDERAYREALRKIDDGRRMMRMQSEFVDTLRGVAVVALRGLRRNPWLTASVVAILALGIGANAVIFGVVDRLLLSPPQHVQDADAVRHLYLERTIFNGSVIVSRSLTYPDFRDFEEVDAFASVAGYTSAREATVGRGTSATQARVVGASGSLFELLGVRPELGRFFHPEDDRIGAEPTAVLAHEYWTRAWGADPDVVGSTLDVGAATYTIVGVAPPGFTGAELEPVDIWVPLTVAQESENGTGWVDHRGWYWLRGVARLAPTATPEAAAAEATAAHLGGRALMIAADDYDAGAQVLVSPIIAAQGPRPSGEARVARWLAGVSLVVLLIACLNVANLLLARAVQMRREVAVRLALGVGRVRLVSERLLESLALALLGAGAAVVVAQSVGSPVHRTLLPGVAFTDGGLSTRLVLFTAAATVLAALVTGLLPAIQVTRADVGDALRSGGRTVAEGRSRLRVGLLVGQAALSVVLLVCAGLFVQSLRQAEALDLGFDADRLAVVSLEWNETLPTPERQAVYDQVVERLRRMPSVREAALTYTVPFRSSISLGQPRVPGLDSIPKHNSGGPYVNKVGAGYFEAMGLEIVQGRALESSDGVEGAAPVTVVSESMARAVWPGGDAVGSCMVIGNEDDAPCTEVVGVVEDHRRQELEEDDPHFLYYLSEGHPGMAGPPQALMVGATGDPRPLLEDLQREARATSGLIRFVNAEAMADLVEPQMRSWRLGASMFTVFGALALIVAAWGLYSLLAFDVALRSHEIGVRSALGADRARIVRMVLRRALALAGTGIVVGLLVSAGGSRFIEPLLFRVEGTDPLVYGLVALTLLLVAAVAGWLPAWRAARVDPRQALQAD